MKILYKQNHTGILKDFDSLKKKKNMQRWATKNLEKDLKDQMTYLI